MIRKELIRNKSQRRTEFGNADSSTTSCTGLFFCRLGRRRESVAGYLMSKRNQVKLMFQKGLRKINSVGGRNSGMQICLIVPVEEEEGESLYIPKNQQPNAAFGEEQVARSVNICWIAEFQVEIEGRCCIIIVPWTSSLGIRRRTIRISSNKEAACAKWRLQSRETGSLPRTQHSSPMHAFLISTRWHITFG